MDSSNKKIVVGCAVAIAIPLLLIAVAIAGLWLKAFNDARESRHLTVWQAIAEWHSQSVREEAGLTPDQREHRELNRAAWQMACPVAALVIAVYFVPTIVAIRRKHSQLVPIAALNVLLGWSFVGWVIALVWSLVSEDPKTLLERRN